MLCIFAIYFIYHCFIYCWKQFIKSNGKIGNKFASNRGLLAYLRYYRILAMYKDNLYKSKGRIET